MNEDNYFFLFFSSPFSITILQNHENHENLPDDLSLLFHSYTLELHSLGRSRILPFPSIYIPLIMFIHPPFLLSLLYSLCQWASEKSKPAIYI